MNEEDYSQCFLAFENGLSAQIEMSRANRLSSALPWYVSGDKGDILVSRSKVKNSPNQIVFKVSIKTDEGGEEQFDITDSYSGTDHFKKKEILLSPG